MISDTLSDAIAEILRDLDSYPETYPDEGDNSCIQVTNIYKALEAMEIARISLDD